MHLNPSEEALLLEDLGFPGISPRNHLKVPKPEKQGTSLARQVDVTLTEPEESSAAEVGRLCSRQGRLGGVHQEPLVFSFCFWLVQVIFG